MMRSRHALACLLAAVTLAPSAAHAQTPGVAAIQASEARNADTRTLAALESFRAALIARFGADPSLAMLRWSETEGSALVVKPGGGLEFVIRQGDAWKSTDARKPDLRAPPSVAEAHAFKLSSVKAAPIRAWVDAWRNAPGQATDFVSDYAMSYDPAAGRVVVRAVVGSMTSGKLSQPAFDPGNGSAVALAAAPRPVPPGLRAAPKRSDDLRNDIGLALAALRREAPSARLSSMRISRDRIEFTMADRTTWTFDTSHTMKSGPRYDGIWICDQGWLEDEVDWTRLARLPRNGVLAAGLDDEDEAHARYTIDRSRDCRPLSIEVTYDNYRTPQPWARFDARGRFLTSR